MMAVTLAAVPPPDQRDAEAQESKRLVAKAHEVSNHVDDLVAKIERIDRLYRERLRAPAQVRTRRKRQA